MTAIFVPLERLFAVQPAKIIRDGIGADLGYYFLGGLVTALLLSLPVSGIAWVAKHFVPYPIQTAFSGIGFWPRALVAFVVGDIGFYWGHRLLHAVPLLWRFHAVHHSPVHVDFMVNSRLHPIDLVFSRMSGFVPIYVLGLAQPATVEGGLLPALVTITGTTWTFFIHANVRWRPGLLEAVISTPRFHHWHHALQPANRNFASMLPVLDRLFGTLHLPKREWPELYGIPGVVPDSWIDQLIRPMVGSFPLPSTSPAPVEPLSGTSPEAPGIVQRGPS